MHRAPTQLRPRDGEGSPDRFDDPQNNYRVRYFASTVRGSLLEVLDHFRPDEGAEEALAHKSVEGVDILEEEPAGMVPDRWLSLQRIVTARVVAARSFVDVSEAETLAALATVPSVQKVLRSDLVTSAFGPHVRLDLGTICAVGRAGRAVTQAVSQAIYMDPSRPSGIGYVTRFDKTERCWAVFDDRARIDFSDPSPLDYWDAEVRSAARDVAKLYQLVLPADWRT